jgi:predicted MPP superfamily phosphohydrolase
MNNVLFFFFFFFTSTLFSQTDDPEYSIYLIGDAGAATYQDTVINKLHVALAKEDSNSAVIFLGDNVYPMGLTNEQDKTRKDGEHVLNVELNRLKTYNGKTIVLPGNHDYARGKKNGAQYVKNQELYINDLLGDSTFKPYNGCPDPVELHLTDDILLIVLDTEWPLYPYQNKTSLNDCDCKTSDQMFLALQDIVSRNYNKQIMVVGHHPVYTYGNHGGEFTWKDHLFPLTAKFKGAYLPLPVIGSLYPLSRELGMNPQDVNHPKNSKMRVAFEEIFKQHPNLIYSSGHEHSLQYIAKDSVHYIVSGSGSKTTYVKKGKYAEFVASEKGYTKVSYYSSGRVEMKMYNSQGVLFTREINSSFSKTAAKKLDERIFTDSVTVSANENYIATNTKEAWFGENYRAEWNAPIKVPVFDIRKMKGGLKVIQKGGGQATLSLRLEDSLGYQYTLRTVDKNTIKAVPEELRKTIAKDVVQDQTSASHPYGAIVVPPMAEAIDIYHTNPIVVFVPDDPEFGVYQSQVANTLFLFEERPTKNNGSIESFGNSKKIYSTPKVVKKLKEDNDNKVDYKFTVRSRLFDMVLGDWDRHDDQWRWASFKEGKGKMFRPIPRDRDQVFFINEGFLMKVASRKWIMPKFEGFNEDIRWEEGFNFNARYFDRYFLAQASKEDWLNEAEYIQNHLTDEVIENALHSFPDTIFQLHGLDIIKTLKIRRNHLVKIAMGQYEALARSVSVLGSDKTEFFEIERLSNGKTSVRVRKISSKGNLKQVIYYREFDKKDTKEIRIYGFAGDDKFVFKGNTKNKIKVRVIAGSGIDNVVDESTNKSRKNIFIYDMKDSLQIAKGGSTRLRLSNKVNVNEYDRASFKYNSIFPLVYLGYTPDDGILVGGGFIKTTYAFRKLPYATRHQFAGGVSFLTGAFKMKYTGHFTKSVGNLDIYLSANLQSPRNSNFYGLGNESIKDPDEKSSYYRFNYSDFKVDPMLLWNISSKHKFKFGLAYRQTYVADERFTSGGYITDSDWKDYLEDPVGRQNYLGIQANYEFDSRDNTLIPKKGMSFSIGASTLDRFDEEFANFTNIRTELSVFKTVKLPRDLTFGARFGGASNIGDYHYLLSNKIGGKNSLRGFRRDRFYGRSSLYNTVEMRYDLYKIKTIVFPFTIGLIGFHDVGRVWLDGEDSDKWHQSYGAGVYITPIDAMALSFQIAKSSEILAFYFDLGFSF